MLRARHAILPVRVLDESWRRSVLGSAIANELIVVVDLKTSAGVVEMGACAFYQEDR